MSWKDWIMMDYGKIKILGESQRSDWIKSTDSYQLINIDWLADNP